MTEVQDQMNMAADEARQEFVKLMAKPTAKATELVAFHQKWYQKAGHKRLGALYRDYSGG